MSSDQNINFAFGVCPEEFSYFCAGFETADHFSSDLETFRIVCGMYGSAEMQES